MVRRASLAAFPVIAGLVGAVYLACWLASLALGLPGDLGLPWAVRGLGVPLLAYGIGMAGWMFSFRGPGAVLDSTWVTFQKLFLRLPLGAPGTRAESLVVAGPYRFVRHPLYSGVDGLAFGIAVLVDHPWAYGGALVLALWFALVLAPFEERELIALFGPAYRDYRRSVRRFLPVRRRAQ